MKKFCSYFGISYFLLFGTIILLLATAQDVYAQTKKKKSGVVAPIPPKEPEPTYQLHLTHQGNTLYRLVLPVHATKNELYAAEVLQKLIGQNERLNELDRVIDLNGLKKAGFHILTDQTRLIIAGGLDKGSLYGVYTFLENYLQLILIR